MLKMIKIKTESINNHIDLKGLKIEELANQLVLTLTNKGLKLKIAESFTGGHICSLLTKISGASAYLLEAIVCYNPTSKTDRLGVPQASIDQFGAVSFSTITQMLDGLMGKNDINPPINNTLNPLFFPDIAIATTGNAGPTSEKPNQAGICYIGVATKNIKIIKKVFIKGDRTNVITNGSILAIKLALDTIK